MTCWPLRGASSCCCSAQVGALVVELFGCVGALEVAPAAASSHEHAPPARGGMEYPHNKQRTETLFRANTYGLTDYPFALHVTPARLYMLSLWLMIPKSTLKQQYEGGTRVCDHVCEQLRIHPVQPTCERLNICLFDHSGRIPFSYMEA